MELDCPTQVEELPSPGLLASSPVSYPRSEVTGHRREEREVTFILHLLWVLSVVRDTTPIWDSPCNVL